MTAVPGVQNYMLGAGAMSMHACKLLLRKTNARSKTNSVCFN